jgi:hypothetical protein
LPKKKRLHYTTFSHSFLASPISSDNSMVTSPRYEILCLKIELSHLLIDRAFWQTKQGLDIIPSLVYMKIQPSNLN